jgi:hypothetical protein
VLSNQILQKQALRLPLGKGIVSLRKNKYKAKDKDGDDQIIEFHVTAYPGMEMKITIAQLIVQNDDD